MYNITEKFGCGETFFGGNFNQYLNLMNISFYQL